MKVKQPFDFWIFLTVLILLSLGIIMVFSASAPFAYNYQNGDIYYFLKKQLFSAVVGIVVMFITLNIDYRKLGALSPILLFISFILLVSVLVPGIGVVKNGARRWIEIGISVQPSELAKLAIILFFSFSLSKRKESLDSFFTGLFPYLVLLGVFDLLLLLEPHLSCTVIVTMVACIILFGAGARIKHFVMLGLPVGVAMVGAITFVPYMRSRVMSFMDPFAHIQDEGWQVVQSLYAIGSGGLFGRGLGKSLQKFLYIPEPHNDFIFSVMAEELGFLGVLAVMLLFLIFIWRGIKVAMNAPDLFGSLVALGITSQIAIQVLFNIAVVTSSVPPTGVSLPFFSYGGTSLMFLLAGIGVLLNISKYANYERI